MSKRQDPIASFYERFPYPSRSAGAHTGSLDWILPSALPAVAHYVFGGRLPERRPLRFLVAGGGTGDAVVALGGWVRRLGLSATIDYVDLSERSCAIARERAGRMGLENVSFRIMALEDLAADETQAFDYIDLCGVLNHVPDPSAALSALSHMLASGGGLGVMVYGSLGRTGVYPAQRALSMLGVDAGREDAVSLARSFLKDLPATNLLRTNTQFEKLSDADDVELADVLLNPRDRAFDVEGLESLFGASGLCIRAFLPPFLYDPAGALRDPALKAAAEALDQSARWQLAELLQGRFRKHLFYATRTHHVYPAVEALLADDRTVLVPAGVDLKRIADGAGAGDRPVGLELSIDGRNVHVGLRLTADEREVLRMIDGPTSIADIHERVPGDREVIEEAIRSVQPRLTRLGLIHVMGG